jgi:hypothetical protein
VFGVVSLEDLRPEAYECSVASVAALHERDEDIVIAFSRPMSSASRVSGTTVGDLPVLCENEEQKQTEAEKDSFQPDSLQLLREDTIQELQRERDEALLMGTYASGEEREVLEIKVEMLDIALEDARAEYASIYKAQEG